MAGATTRWLIDKSALVKLPQSVQRDFWNQQIEASLVHLCFATALEVGYSARNQDDHSDLFATIPLSYMPMVHIGDQAESRALEIQGLLAGRGHHRAPSIPDLLVAATAEVHRFTVLHDDKDFDLIAEITEQPTHRLSAENDQR